MLIKPKVHTVHERLSCRKRNVFIYVSIIKRSHRRYLATQQLPHLSQNWNHFDLGHDTTVNAIIKNDSKYSFFLSQKAPDFLGKIGVISIHAVVIDMTVDLMISAH